MNNIETTYDLDSFWATFKVDDYTDEEKAQLPVFIDKWATCIDNPTNHEDAAVYIRFLYANADLPAPSSIIGLCSFTALHYAIWIANTVMDDTEVKRLAEKCANPQTRKAGLRECAALGCGAFRMPEDDKVNTVNTGYSGYTSACLLDFARHIGRGECTDTQKVYIDFVFDTKIWAMALYRTIVLYCENPSSVVHSPTNPLKVISAQWADGTEFTRQ